MFYKTPDYIYTPVADLEVIKGAVLVVGEADSSLATQVRASGCDTYTCSIEDATGDSLVNLPSIDWVVCVTQGLGRAAEVVFEIAQKVPSKGFCLLDRISFLEPVKRRQHLLTANSLTNMIILSPRPAFRADKRQLKDSVTSAWFVFQPPQAGSKNTKIDFDLNWQRPRINYGK